MSSKALYKLIRAAVIAVAICGAAAFIYLVPLFGADIAKNNPEYAYCYFPWLIFIWITAVPCFVFLIFIWKISTAVKYDTVFTLQTARLVKISAALLFIVVGFFFVGNILFMLLGMNHPGILLLSLIADVFGVSLALMAAVMARYLTKAATLQEEADSTI